MTDEHQERRTSDQHPAVANLLKFFHYDHLPEPLQQVSKPFGDLAIQLDHMLPDNAEKTTALRKLLEAKACAVRSVL